MRRNQDGRGCVRGPTTVKRDPLAMHHPASIYEQEYKLILKPYGLRIEREGRGVDIDHASLFTQGQNVLTKSAGLIERRISGELE